MMENISLKDMLSDALDAGLTFISRKKVDLNDEVLNMLILTAVDMEKSHAFFTTTDLNHKIQGRFDRAYIDSIQIVDDELVILDPKEVFAHVVSTEK